ncbi:MAG: ATP-dependent helicase [Gloeocapsa sp. DLM2.Bin57]|nr:MAG: ATP-dependent helicase [Gloeocapsa sp. DLM2.Bin57]
MVNNKIIMGSSPEQELINNLRPGQKKLATWRGGKMAISAVPGAGKSYSLAIAAALTIAREKLNSERQLVIVTYTRSAAASIKQKIRGFLKDLSLPLGSFTVQTLHGLALNIANLHQELHELDLATTNIIELTSSHQLISNAVEEWISQDISLYEQLIKGFRFDGEETERLRRESLLRTELLPSLAYGAIREAKSSGLNPESLAELSQKSQDRYQILAIAAGLYQQYQHQLREQNYLDYDDLILAALKVLENQQVRETWQHKIYAVFEDEAQDSSPLQERLITILAQDPVNTEQVNLIRVGDPNQAINSTFTPADPVYFNWFCQECEQRQQLGTMNEAGRSSKIIIESANSTLKWLINEFSRFYPIPSEDLPFRDQEIIPVTNPNPQEDANPNPEGKGVELSFPEDIYQTVTEIGEKVIKLLQQYPHHNAAILVRENRQGSFLAQQLSYLESLHKIRIYEVHENQRHSQIPQEILNLLSFLERPHSPDLFKKALLTLAERQLIPQEDFNALATYPEEFLYPNPLTPPQSPNTAHLCRSLLKAKLELPPYQLIPFLGMTLQYQGTELATLQKLSATINQKQTGHNSLSKAIAVLKNMINNNEKFTIVEEDNQEQYTRTGQLTIITMHKAKGLEWDYVFIPFLHQDTIPGELKVTSNAKFLGDFSLSQVARAQLRHALHAQYQGQPVTIPNPKQAWLEAKKLKLAEEFRLFYVAITRAKRLLWLAAEKSAPFNWSNVQKHQTYVLTEKKPSNILSCYRNTLLE